MIQNQVYSLIVRFKFSLDSFNGGIV